MFQESVKLRDSGWRKGVINTGVVARPNISTNRARITPLDIKKQIMRAGLPSGIELVEPREARARMLEKGFRREECYRPEETIEVRLDDPHNLCALTLFLEMAFAATRADLPEKAKLYEVFGEAHPMSAYIMAQACAVAARPGSLYCLEQPADDLAFCAEYYDLPRPNLDLEVLQRADPFGHLYAQAELTGITKDYYDAPLARDHRFQTILNTGGTLALVDAMDKRGGIYLNEDDPLVPQMVAKLFNHKIDLARMDLPSFSGTPEHDNRGSIARNFIMASRSVDAATLHNANNIIIGVGRRHLGDRANGVTYERALPFAVLEEVARNNQRHTGLVSVFFASHEADFMPERIVPPGRHPFHIPVIVHGLSEAQHDCYPFLPSGRLEVQREFIGKLRQSFVRAGQARHPAFRAFDPPAVKQYDVIKDELRTALKL